MLRIAICDDDIMYIDYRNHVVSYHMADGKVADRYMDYRLE